MCPILCLLFFSFSLTLGNDVLENPVVFSEEQQMDLCREKWWRENYDYCKDIMKQLPKWYQETEEYLLNFVFNHRRKHAVSIVSTERMDEIVKLSDEGLKNGE